MSPLAAEDIGNYLRAVFQAAHLDLEVNVVSGEGEVRIQLTGRDSTILLARNAELMNALEYLTNRAFGRNLSRETRIVFDSNNYRSARESELRLMARKAAEKVKISRAPFIFEPMNSSERRVIHLTLVEESGVRTESRGEGEDRKVVVLPA